MKLGIITLGASSISWCDLMGSILFSWLFCMHVELFSYRSSRLGRGGGAVGAVCTCPSDCSSSKEEAVHVVVWNCIATMVRWYVFCTRVVIM